MFDIQIDITPRNKLIDDYALRQNHAIELSRYYGIGQFRHIPRKKIASNAARIGIVKKNRKNKIKRDPDSELRY